MNPLPISPAIVAALNQWGLIGNMNNQNQDQVISFIKENICIKNSIL